MRVLERVVNGDMQPTKVGDVSGSDSERPGFRDTQDHQVPVLHDAPLLARGDLDVRACEGCITIQREYIAPRTQQVGEPGLEKLAPSSRAQAFDSRGKLVDRDSWKQERR